MRSALAVGFSGMLLLTLLAGSVARAETTENLLIRLLIKKGILTEQEVEARPMPSPWRFSPISRSTQPPRR